MSFGIFIIVLCAALMHVTWNSFIRGHQNKNTMMMLIMLGHGLVGVPIILWHSIPEVQFWGWIVASTIVHLLYQIFLIRAYHYGDLSRVYPIARGAAPMFVLLASPTLIGEVLHHFEISGILTIGLGIALLSWGVLRQQETLRLIPLALCSAACTASYSIIDGLGARLMDDALLYNSWVMFLNALIWLGICKIFIPESFRQIDPAIFVRGMIGGSISFGAYAIVLWAMIHAPIVLVTALRETSVLFAILVGAVFLKEKVDATKILAALTIVLGVGLTRLG